MGLRDPSAIYPFNLLDMAATAWAPPDLPLFSGAPAPTGAPVAVSAPAAGTPPWLRPLHEIQQAALSLNPSDPASSGDTAAIPWTSDWSATPRISAAAPPYADRAVSNPYLGSAGDAGELDPTRTRRLLAEAKRASDSATPISGHPSVRPAQPMGYVAAATDAPRPSTPGAGSDEQFDGAVRTKPPRYELGPASHGLFLQSSGWPSPRASVDAASPPIVVAAGDQADPNGHATIPYPGPDSMFLPGSPSAMKAGQNFIRNIQDLIDTWGKWFNVTDQEKEACYKQWQHDREQCFENHSYNSTALSGCLERAGAILGQCLRGGPEEARPWTDVDTDGVEIPKRPKKK